MEEYSNIQCKAGDIRELDIPDSSFDVISAIHVIHDITPAERQDIVKTQSQKLKKGGLLFIPVEEIQALLSDAGLNEIENKATKSEHGDKYQKAG